NQAKDAANSASAAIAAPLAPSAAPIQNPGRRPIRAISRAAGIVAVIMPVICTAIGRVESALSGASMLPTIEAVVATMLPPVIARAWHSASIRTVRREEAAAYIVR